MVAATVAAVTRIGCSLDAGRSLDEAVERVRLAESLGYESVWVTHIAAREPLQVLGHYGHRTERIGLGTGVIPIMLRHPALMAMEAATLDEITGGRLTLGLGVSHKVTVEGWYGLSLEDPVGQMREYLTIVRDILERGGAGIEGRHFTARFSFLRYSARSGMKLVIAALGERMLRLAAELADGVVLWMCSPAYIRETVRPTIEKALAEHGRSIDDFDIVANVPVALGGDEAGARDATRRRVLPYVQLPFYRAVIAAGGHEQELEAFDRALASGSPDDALRELGEAFVDDYAGIGDGAAVRAKVEEYRQSGVTLPSLGPITGHEGGASVEELLGAAVAGG